MILLNPQESLSNATKKKSNKRALIKEKDIIITFKDRQLFHRRHRPKDLFLNVKRRRNHFHLSINLNTRKHIVYKIYQEGWTRALRTDMIQFNFK